MDSPLAIVLSAGGALSIVAGICVVLRRRRIAHNIQAARAPKSFESGVAWLGVLQVTLGVASLAAAWLPFWQDSTQKHSRSIWRLFEDLGQNGGILGIIVMLVGFGAVVVAVWLIAAFLQKPCVKTWDYLERRTLPEVESPVPAGASLEHTYEYDAAGSVTDSVRTITGPAVPELDEGPGAPSAPSAPDAPSVPEPVEGADTTPSVETLTHAFTYDSLGRLTRSEASDGETNTYGYDEAGNRTSWNINGAESGNSKLTAVFNEAAQLTSTTTTGANAGSASYTFDGAGNRSSQVLDRVTNIRDSTCRGVRLSNDGEFMGFLEP